MEAQIATMKIRTSATIKILGCFLLLVVAASAQQPKTELTRLHEDLIKATKEYKASLEKLLVIYEDNVKIAEEKLVTSKELLDARFLTPTELQRHELAIRAARAKVEDVKKQILNADIQIRDVQTIFNPNLISPAATLPGDQRANQDCKGPPTIRGLRLRMTASQFAVLYPRAKIENRDILGFVEKSINGHDDSRLKGVSSLVAGFLDGRLYSINVFYENQIEWAGIDEFVRQFSAATGLPLKWDGLTNSSRSLGCKGFSVFAVMLSGTQVIHISDTVISREYVKRLEQLKARQRALEEKQKSPASFRP